MVTLALSEDRQRIVIPCLQKSYWPSEVADRSLRDKTFHLVTGPKHFVFVAWCGAQNENLTTAGSVGTASKSSIIIAVRTSHPVLQHAQHLCWHPRLMCHQRSQCRVRLAFVLILFCRVLWEVCGWRGVLRGELDLLRGGRPGSPVGWGDHCVIFYRLPHLALVMAALRWNTLAQFARCLPFGSDLQRANDQAPLTHVSGMVIQ